MPLEEEVRPDDLFESLRRRLQLPQDGVLEVVPEHVLVVLEGLLVALGGPVEALEARLVVVRLRAQDQRLDGDQDLREKN